MTAATEEYRLTPLSGPTFNKHTMPKKEKDLTVICNPPINFVNNQETHIGHLFYHTILDIYYRFKKNILNKNIYFPGRSYNLYGKPSQDFMFKKNMSKCEFIEYFQEQLRNDLDNRDINLANTNLIVDESQLVEEYLENLYRNLQDKGHLIKDGASLLLDLSKIDEKDFINKLNNVNFNPVRIKDIVLSQFKKRKDCIEITKERDYSPRISLCDNTVAPFVIVSTFWDAYYPQANFVLACSFNLIVRSALFRMLIEYLAYGNLGTKEIIVYPKIVGSDVNTWRIDNIKNEIIYKDLLRLALMINYTLKRERIIGYNNSQKFAVKFARKLISYRMMYSDNPNEKVKITDTKYIEMMKKCEFQKALHYMWNRLLSLSKIQNKKKERGVYYTLLEMLRPFIPKLTSILKDPKISDEDLLKIEIKIESYLQVLLGKYE